MITFSQFLTELPRTEYLQSRIRDAEGMGLRNKTRAALDKLGEKYSFSRLGDGLYGVTYKSVNYPYIIKIWRNDEGYDYWLRFVTTNQQNPWVPKVKGRPTKIPGSDYTFIRLELLEPVTRSEYTKFIDKKERWEQKHRHPERHTPDRAFAEVMQAIRAYTSEDDIHDSNLMKRSNGQLVITDPLG